jgi:hypothetical protein
MSVLPAAYRQEHEDTLAALREEQQRRAEEAAQAAEAAGEALDMSFYPDLKRIHEQLETFPDIWPFLEPVSDVEVRCSARSLPLGGVGRRM